MYIYLVVSPGDKSINMVNVLRGIVKVFVMLLDNYNEINAPIMIRDKSNKNDKCPRWDCFNIFTLFKINREDMQVSFWNKFLIFVWNDIREIPWDCFNILMLMDI